MHRRTVLQAGLAALLAPYLGSGSGPYPNSSGVMIYDATVWMDESGRYIVRISWAPGFEKPRVSEFVMRAGDTVVVGDGVLEVEAGDMCGLSMVVNTSFVGVG